MLVQDLIERKRDGGQLTPAEWTSLVNDYTRGDIDDPPMSAFLMACAIQGLSGGETAALTDAMLLSGDRLDLSDLPGTAIDKRSTGGVGDKVSIVLAPIVSCLGVTVPMMAGRGLGHTGGTLDKLEAIPGFRTALSMREIHHQLGELRCAFMAATSEIAPADRKMYALRHATATVASVPLIAASIMSKKLAEGLSGLVLDVKHGSGALVPELERAVDLAELMVALGMRRGCRVVALVTAMDRPLGRACGNALEIEESIHALQGEGPDDLMDVTWALGAEMLMLAGVARGEEDGRAEMRDVVSSGRAATQLELIIEAQGGNPAVVEDPALLPQAAQCELYAAPRDGFVRRVEPRRVGRGVLALGGGRLRPTDGIDPSVGFVITAKPGDWVRATEPLATIFARDTDGVDLGRACLAEAIVLADEPEAALALVSHRVSNGRVERYPIA